MNDNNAKGNYKYWNKASQRINRNNENYNKDSKVKVENNINYNKEPQVIIENSINEVEIVTSKKKIDYIECEKQIQYENQCCNIVSAYQGIVSTTKAAGESIIMFEAEFFSGNRIKQLTDTIFTLEDKGIYQISYNIKACLSDEGAISIYPRLNGCTKRECSTTAVNNLYSLCVSATGTFLIDAMEECLYLDFLIVSSECSFDISGCLSIIQII